MLRFILLCISLSLTAKAEKPIWSKNAVPIGDCSANVGHRIPSPDGHTILELRCREAKGESDPIPYLHVKTPGGDWHELSLDEGAYEVLWSPDSKAFLINGGTSAYSGFFVTIYLVSNADVKKLHVTEAAQVDMVKVFPPCRALNRDDNLCAKIAKHPAFNMSGIAWLDGSSGIVVMAEIPCSSSYGGIMCQVQGYELTVPSGSIAMRLTPRDLKARWQQSMAWTLHIPDRPEYGSAPSRD
jgi:hypothetical protein